MLFCDVRGFTAISESYKDNPQDLTRLINRFLTPMTDLIMARHGTIDKYMGDCIMAFWNAPLDDPLHADHACESALAMMRALDGLNADLEAEAQAAGRAFHPLKVGIGLNTGAVVVGNMGSNQRFDYSVLGDAVNLASRLEGQSKTYGVGIVIGETTRAAAPRWATLELDRIAVKGKAEAVRIYALMGDETVAAAPGFAALAGKEAAFLELYRAQDWPRARAALAEVRAADGSLAILHDLYEERIDHFEAEPPGPDWDGVYVAETK
jgi:adenylate cyclase